MDQNKIIKNLNDNLDDWQIKIIWRTNRIDKKIRRPKRVLVYKDFDDKELKFEIFKLKLADISNEINEKLFE